MECVSPGNQPVAYGNVCGGAIHAGPLTCMIDPFNPWFPTYTPSSYQPAGWAPLPDQHTHYHFASVQAKLSDDDIERIARRVAEILREAKP